MEDRVVVIKDIVIPKGTVLYPAASMCHRLTKHYETDIGIGPDNTANFCIDGSAVYDNPDTFTDLK